jgi:hypothetical protein
VVSVGIEVKLEQSTCARLLSPSKVLQLASGRWQHAPIVVVLLDFHLVTVAKKKVLFYSEVILPTTDCLIEENTASEQRAAL